MFEEKNIQTLTKLGLSTSQAKVYLGLAHSGKSNAKAIAKTVKIDKAEVYRTIAKLEEKGLVLRILGNPTEFEAVPLKNLVTILLKQKRGEISEIEKSAMQLLRQNIKGKIDKIEDYLRIAQKTEPIITEIIDDWTKMEKEVDMVSTIDAVLESSLFLNASWLKAMEKGVKIRIICEKVEKKRVLEFSKNLVQHPNFEIRYVTSHITCPFVISDGKKIWIKISGMDFLTSSWLISNNEHLTKLLQYYFNFMLENSTPYEKKS